ncbi:MAG TPA: hypothetical protein VFM18_22390 [Methanosarcina sp.]|nr:hypothetical protein [Methanosarcina sp.]
MITRKTLTDLGYKRDQISQIMQRFNILNLQSHKQKVVNNYIKKGKYGDIQHCEMHCVSTAYKMEEAIKALNEWIPRKNNTDIEFWNSVIKDLNTLKEKE